ncbi:hypothetical protein BX266_0810 [Streptomyces sp. TLI_171]|nr:hypothetical protein BX266_0810 [Streptomyces sp. TLI_171]
MRRLVGVVRRVVTEEHVMPGGMLRLNAAAAARLVADLADSDGPAGSEPVHRRGVRAPG